MHLSWVLVRSRRKRLACRVSGESERSIEITYNMCINTIFPSSCDLSRICFILPSSLLLHDIQPSSSPQTLGLGCLSCPAMTTLTNRRPRQTRRPHHSRLRRTLVRGRRHDHGKHNTATSCYQIIEQNQAFTKASGSLSSSNRQDVQERVSPYYQAPSRPRRSLPELTPSPTG